MKKIIVLSMLLAVSSVVGTKCFADSWNQAQNTDYWSNQAAHSSSNEDAKAKSGCGFDYDCGSSSVVDLSGAGAHPTVQLLKNSDGSNPYTPQQYKSLHTTPPPPLP